MSKSYDILRWDATYTGGQETSPVITLKPDIELLKMVQRQDFTIPVKITGTDFIYDNTLSMVKVEPTQTVLGYRPNYQRDTNTIAFVLNIQWNGYPPKLGQVHVLSNEIDGNMYRVENLTMPSRAIRDLSIYLTLAALLLFFAYKWNKK